MTYKNIPIADPVRELKEIENFDNDFLDQVHKGVFVGGENVKVLEKELSGYLNCKYVVTTNSGTDALIISMSQLNLSPGDEVLIPSFTFFATAEAIMHFGLKPVFVDIDLATFTVKYDSLVENLTDNTKAFIPVHLFGKSSLSTEIIDFCKEKNIKIIEDCAQSFGSKYEEIFLGNIGEMGAFSFFPSKTLGGIGDGGCITTNNENIYHNILKVKNHGQISAYEHEISGVNSRLDSLNAFTLVKKLQIFEKIKLSRRNLFNFFNNNINNEEVRKPNFNNDEVPNYYSILVENRSQLIEHLNLHNISSNIYYKNPIHRQKALKKYGYRASSLKNTDIVSNKILSIPFFAFIEDEEQERIVEVINNFKSK